MKNLTKMLLGALAIAGFAGTASAQDAAAPAPSFTLSGVATMQSDYRFRGISQNSKEFTPEASLTLSAPYGFYVSAWSAKTNWGGNNPSYELDLYGGKHFDLGGTDLNLVAYYYSYPDFRAGKGPSASYYETQVQLTHAFGPLTIMIQGVESPQFTLGSGEGWYVSGTGTYAVADWLTVSSTIGHQWVASAPSDYTHYDFGATATWHSWSLDARYVGTDIGKAACTTFWMATPNACSGGFVATLNYNVADLLK
ncbi:MAG: hypothetical protein JO256_07625 [Alphaproteobacteria bacterium]|nr:hypothetical protein [Alphaproteobacteria bacterium]